MRDQGLSCANKVRLLLPLKIFIFSFVVSLIFYRESFLLKRIDAK